MDVRLQLTQALLLSSRYTVSDCNVLVVPRIALNLLATENKQEQDEDEDNTNCIDKHKRFVASTGSVEEAFITKGSWLQPAVMSTNTSSLRLQPVVFIDALITNGW